MSRNSIILAGLLLASAPAFAADSPGKVGMISKLAATKAALVEFPGQITSSSMATVNGETVYRFTIAAPNQPQRVVLVSATTGKVL